MHICRHLRIQISFDYCYDTEYRVLHPHPCMQGLNNTPDDDRSRIKSHGEPPLDLSSNSNSNSVRPFMPAVRQESFIISHTAVSHSLFIMSNGRNTALQSPPSLPDLSSFFSTSRQLNCRFDLTISPLHQKYLASRYLSSPLFPSTTVCVVRGTVHHSNAVTYW